MLLERRGNRFDEMPERFAERCRLHHGSDALRVRRLVLGEADEESDSKTPARLPHEAHLGKPRVSIVSLRGVIERRRVANGTADHALMLKPYWHEPRTFELHETPAGGFETHEATAGRWNPSRPPSVVRVGDRHDARGNEGRRPAGRAARGESWLPRVVRTAIEQRFSRSGQPKLRHARRAEADEPSREELLRERAGFGRWPAWKRPRAEFERRARDRIAVLEERWHPREGTVVRKRGGLASLIEHRGRKSVQAWVHTLGSRDGRLDDLGSLQFAAPNTARYLHGIGAT